ncbi:PHP domain-containing protein [Lachnospiraceae bacterium 47-T17]
MIRDVMDLHTHTIASGHAYSTILELIQAAKEKNLELLGITEHGPRMKGSCAPIYFQNLKVIPRERFGVTTLFGVELNIMDEDGSVDLEPERATLLVCGEILSEEIRKALAQAGVGFVCWIQAGIIWRARRM